MEAFKKPLIFFSICAIALFTLSCGPSEVQDKEEGTLVAESDSTEQEKVVDNRPPPEDRKFNDLARFIAGMAPEEGSSYAELSQSPAWQQYSQVCNNQWTSINQNKIPTMAQWRDQEISAANEASGLVFYPFSGPDFMHVNTFFPKAKEVVMIGLEPIGDLPDMENISKSSLGGYLNGLQQTLYNILNLSFFRTISMAQDFTGKRVSTIDGTLPILMLFLTRTDHKILYYEKVAVSPEGKLIPATEASSDTTYYGTKISYESNDEPGLRKNLYYFAANLQNTPYTARSGLSEGGLLQRKDFRAYLESLDISSTYLKSASYLMYRETFSIVRNIILDKSEYLLQDDSG
ncbi:MAG: hypothetical protein AAFU64_08615, partial [Bacteroidota bacterium]